MCIRDRIKLSPEKMETAKIEGLISAFLSRVKVSPNRTSRLVHVTFESYDPELAARAVNTLADKFISWLMDRRLDATKAAREFLRRQLDEAKANLERAEEELNKFSKIAGIVSLDSKLNIEYKELAEMNNALAGAEAERVAKEALFSQVKEGDYNSLPQVLDSEIIQNLKEEQAKLQSEYNNMALILKPKYPRMKRLAAQIAEIDARILKETNRVADSIKKDYEAALKKEELLRKQSQQKKNAVGDLNERATQYNILKREVDTNKSIYQSLLQRLKETEVTSGIKASNVQVVDYASTPLSPYKPNVRFNLLIAIAMGLMGGVFLAFLLEYFDNTIKTPDEIRDRLFLPVLGAVPRAYEANGREIEKAMVSNPKSPIAESFRTIRVSLSLSFPEHPPRSVLITSSQPLEGKTTVSSNLAISLVQAGSKVLIMDADLRKPRLHKIFLNGDGSTYGLSTYLTRAVEIKELIKPTEVKGLDILPSGAIPPNPVELLSSTKMKELLGELAGKYDYIIVDSPPAVGVADALALSTMVDGVIIVASTGITQKEALRHLKRQLTGLRAQILGVILNRLEAGKRGYGYSYYYYYSHYDYGEEGHEKIHKGKKEDVNILPRS